MIDRPSRPRGHDLDGPLVLHQPKSLACSRFDGIRPGQEYRQKVRAQASLSIKRLPWFLRVALVGAVFFLLGCAAAAPRDSIWTAIEPFDNAPITEPLDIPLWPEFIEADGVLTLTAQGGQKLRIYREVAEVNHEIAWDHVDQIAELRIAHDALARAGQAEYEIAELRLVTLEEERRAHLWSRFSDWLAMAILAVAAIY